MPRHALARGGNSVIANGALIAGVLTLVLSAVLLALAVTALTARALFVAAVTCTLMAAIAGQVLLTQGDSLAAIGLVAFGVAFFPVWLMGAMLLSTNAVKNGKRRAAWLTVLAALATTAVLVVVTPELMTTPGTGVEDPVGLPAVLTALMFVVCVAVIGLIGYGERGAFARRGRSAP
jgi:hypothetical protein